MLLLELAAQGGAGGGAAVVPTRGHRARGRGWCYGRHLWWLIAAGLSWRVL